jgi:hypothetical protein
MLIVLIHNDGTGTEEKGNYNWEVRINERLLAFGRIEDHDRLKSWSALLKRVADREGENLGDGIWSEVIPKATPKKEEKR